MVDYIYNIGNVKGLTINDYNSIVDFHDWLYEKYIEWRGEHSGREGSKAEFARWIGITDKSLFQYFMKEGQIPKSPQIINKLVNKYGDEVYEVLNIHEPEISILKIEEILPKLNQNQQIKFMRRLNQILDEFINNELGS
ncbi:MAG: hypothetical protein A2029_01465 [Chloroflexi bacterium RBG_19FT_COMBO_47_9]|nr:MAG: hypothetical protein A2W25_05000 [candidate division Zixibacteria bacterium RBG_16_53_22]OGO66575.1 MAG: hypothetical protein A2029_01465 [Chloroflexi bacterium RBG_19FT_COMBO_47_9]